MIRFNTAIFYDIENLTKGQSYSNVSALSLSEIYQKIRDLPYVDHISLQRAYANWGDNRLSVLKDEVNSLGIDPIQVFGFAKHQPKNAADIQLVVDAIEINFTRALIDTYVIVSGDGGFASLVKKLHEYSRRVVVCAYGNATNGNLKAVADEFIELQDPEEHPIAAKVASNPTILKSPKKLGDAAEPPSKKLVVKPSWISKAHQEITPITPHLASPELLLNTSKNILSWLQQDEENRKKLREGGILLSVIMEAFKYVIPEFKPELLGFGKFGELLQFLCHETELCVIGSLHKSPALAFRAAVPQDVQVLPDLTPATLHTVERYQQLLVQGKPKISTDLELKFEPLGQALVKWVDLAQPLDSWISLLKEALPEYDLEIIKHFCHTLIQGDILERQPLELPLAEQILSLKPEFQQFADMAAAIDRLAETKLKGILGEEVKLVILRRCLQCWEPTPPEIGDFS
ncbi:MAG: NYN domain-containing protein [Pseudanabaenaceae cyanobacterium bins.68]|nr:NYN domain-containing protein [Pseudanabaenaceae cyanobacterium bins.68]